MDTNYSSEGELAMDLSSSLKAALQMSTYWKFNNKTSDEHFKPKKKVLGKDEMHILLPALQNCLLSK
eukprot:15365000-Ditylum_brightwellii.AAC.1